MGNRILLVWIFSLAAGLLVGYGLAPVPSPEIATVPPGPPPAVSVADSLPPETTVPPFPEPSGDGRIEGVVTTLAGIPVPGVVVIACRNTPRDGRSFNPPSPLVSDGPPDPDRELRKRIAGIEKDHRYRAATRRDAVSGEDGRFVLFGLGEERYMIRGFREGYVVTDAGDGRWLKTGETATLHATPVIRLPVSVVNPDGSPAREAEIRMDGGFERSASWSPEQSILAVPPGPLTLSARSLDDELQSDEVEIVVPETAPREPVVLNLTGMQWLDGTVTLPPGIRPAFHCVVALELPPRASEQPERLLEEGRRETLIGSSGPRAPYHMEDLAPGRYLLGVIRRGKSVLMSRIVTVGFGRNTQDFVLPGAEVADPGDAEPGPEPRFTLVRVLAPDGSPALWARVRAEIRNSRGGAGSHGTAVQVEPGVHRVYASPPAANESCFLLVTSEKHGNSEVPFDPRTDREVSVRLTEPAFVKVLLPDFEAAGLEGKCRLIVGRPGRWNNSTPGFEKTPPEPDGSQTFGPLQPGEWEIYLWYGRGSGPFLTRKVTLAPGRQEIVVQVPRIFHLDVVVEGEDGDKGFYLERLDGPFARYFSEVRPDGRIRFDGLVAGEYVLSRHHGPRQHMPLTITGDRTVRFVPIVLDALRVEIADGAGALAQSGLRHGDLVLKLDGREITGSNYGWVIRQLGDAKESAVLTIRRNGEEVELTVNPAGFNDPQRSGGEIRPWRR
jgi:hypothetical protein